jgi:hypothetical protein
LKEWAGQELPVKKVNKLVVYLDKKTKVV